MTDQLNRLKALLGNPQENNIDEILEFYLENASDIICDIRNSDKVEQQYKNTQIKMAVEMYSRRGAEGQSSHTENGISRVYQGADISNSLLRTITPVAKTPFSEVRVI